jgi:solute carrier family 8 (sodium/calcium exchanger)
MMHYTYINILFYLSDKFSGLSQNFCYYDIVSNFLDPFPILFLRTIIYCNLFYRDEQFCSTEEVDDEEIMQDLECYDNQHDSSDNNDDCTPESVAKHISHNLHGNISLGYGPHPKFSRGDEVYALERELKMVTEKKFICSLDLMLEVFARCCQTPGCADVPHITYHFVGTTLIVNCSCQSGHTFRFCSSREVNLMYVNNIQISAAVLLSGSNYGKINRLAQVLNLAFPSKSTYFRIQRLYLLPAVDEWWGWMRGQLVDEFSGQDIVIGGDGQCDSPGFNAKNLCYFVVEVNYNYILHVEVVDKRHVGLVSTNMEREGVKKSLQKLQDDLHIVELVTDASTSIKKLLGIKKLHFAQMPLTPLYYYYYMSNVQLQVLTINSRLISYYPMRCLFTGLLLCFLFVSETEFKDIVHSLDVWHKSKSIKKCLAKVSQCLNSCVNDCKFQNSKHQELNASGMKSIECGHMTFIL